METAIMQQTQAIPDMFVVNQQDQNHTDDEEFSNFPYLLSVKKSHSTPHHSLSEKFNVISDRAEQQRGNNLQEIKEQDKTEILNDENANKFNDFSNQKQYLSEKKLESVKFSSPNFEKLNKKSRNKDLIKQGQDYEMRKFSTAASEELKVDFPQQHSKSNSSSLCNIYDSKTGIIDFSAQKLDQQSKLDNISNIQRQEESKKIQTLYQESNEKNKFFEEKIRKNIKEYALDKYSHFIVILILEQGSAGHKRIIIENNLKEKEYFSHEQFGHKVLNKSIEVSKKEFADLYTEFIKYILDNNSKTYQSLQNDKFGNYVIQKCLEIFEDEHLTELLILLNTTLLIKPEQKLASLPNDKLIKDNDLCSDQYGCLIIQKLIEIYKIKPEGKIKKLVGQMIEKVINDSYRLAQRQFSNYVVQQIIEKGAAEHKNLLYQNVISKQFINLSMDKYGSNVAEKAVKNADQEQKKLIWNLISASNFSALFNMVNDQYANYVVQRIFDFSSPKEQKQMYQQLNEWSRKNKLKENGKHPFKYIEDIVKLNDQGSQSQSQYRGNQNRVMTQNNNNVLSNHQGNRQQNNNYNYQKGQYSINTNNFNNQNNTSDFGSNMRQSNYTNNNQQGNKSRNDQQNNSFFDSRNNNQTNANGQNRNQGNNYQKNRSNNNYQSYPQNKQPQNLGDSPSNSESQQYDQNQQRFNKSNRTQNQQQQQIQQNNYSHSQKNVNQPIQQKSSNNNEYQSNPNNGNKHNQNGKRINYQGDYNYQHNNNTNRPYKRNNQRGNYNNPAYYYSFPQYYQFQQPYLNLQQGYYIPYMNQHTGGYIDPQFMPYFDPNLQVPNIMSNQNVPYYDFLNGAQKILQKSENEDGQKKGDQSEITTQSNSLNSTQNEKKDDKLEEKSGQDQDNNNNNTTTQQ